LDIPDRVPVLPNTRSFSPKYAGLKYNECLKNPAKYNEAEVKLFTELDYDAVWGIASNGVLEELLGAKIKVFEDAAPVVEPMIKEPKDLLNLKVPANISESPNVELLCRATSQLKEMVGPDVMVIGSGPAAIFRTACLLRGITNFYMDIVLNEQFVMDLQEFCFQPSLDFAKAVFSAGADAIFMGNSVANSGCISRKHYEKFVHPFNKRFFAALKELNLGPVVYHTCGNWDDRWDLVADEGPEIVLIGDGDLAEIKEKWGDRFCIMGNVHSVNTMLRGSLEDVEKEAVDCTEKAWSKGGFILSNDCTLSRDTPVENVKALVEVAKRYRY